MIWPRILWRLLGFWQSFWQWRNAVAQRKAGANAERVKATEAENDAKEKIAGVDADHIKRTIVEHLRDGEAF